MDGREVRGNSGLDQAMELGQAKEGSLAVATDLENKSLHQPGPLFSNVPHKGVELNPGSFKLELGWRGWMVGLGLLFSSHPHCSVFSPPTRLYSLGHLSLSHNHKESKIGNGRVRKR